MENDTTYPEFTSWGADMVVPEDEFCVYGIVYAHPDKSDLLEQVYAETTLLAASEPGILHYSVARDPDNRDAFHFYERYTGRAAFETHNSQPIIIKLLNEDKFIKGVRYKFVKAIQAAGDAGAVRG